MLTVLLLAAPAVAAPPAPPAPDALEALLSSGEALTRAGDPGCAKPLEKALFAAEKDDAAYARATAALGLCREVQGRYGNAHQLVARALEAAPAETTPAGKAPRWVVLRSALRRLDERVARVLVSTEPKSVEVFMDGASMGAADGKVLAVDPGVHVFEAREGGRTVAAEQITARAGDLPAVSLRAPPSAPARAATSSPAASSTSSSLPPPPSRSPLVPEASPRGVAVGIAYGAGGVALVSGIVAGALEAQRSALASGLAPGACAGSEKSARCSDLDLAFHQRTAARNVALVAGGLALAAGGTALVLHLTLPAVQVTATSASFSVGGSW